MNELEKIISKAFEEKQNVNSNSDKKIIEAVKKTIELTDKGEVRVAQKINGNGR